MSDSPTHNATTAHGRMFMLSVLFCCGSSLADTTLTFTNEGDSLPQSIAIGAGKMRINPAGDGNWMLYDLQQNAMFIMDDAKQQYYRIDPSQIEQLGQSLGNLNSQLDNALANLPPQQRAAAKAMMQDMLPDKQAPSAAAMIDIRNTGKKDKVADIACSIHETWVADERKNEVCVAAGDALRLSSEDEDTMRGMAKLMQQLMDEVQKNLGELMPDNIAADGLAQLMANGIPVRIRDFDHDSSAELAAISHDSIADQQLSVPVGYQAQTMDLGQ